MWLVKSVGKVSVRIVRSVSVRNLGRVSVKVGVELVLGLLQFAKTSAAPRSKWAQSNKMSNAIAVRVRVSVGVDDQRDEQRNKAFRLSSWVKGKQGYSNSFTVT